MALFSCSGAAVLRGVVSFPARGVWFAELVLDTAAAPTGPVVIEASGMALTGVARGGSAYGRTAVRVVGGHGGHRRTLSPKAFRGVPLRLPLADALGELGEAVAATSTPAVLTARLPVWGRQATRLGEELDALADAASATWRVLDDGSTWVGVETWAESTLEHRVIDVAPAEGRRVLAVDAYSLRPGVMLDGARVSRVTYRITPERVRVEVYGG